MVGVFTQVNIVFVFSLHYHHNSVSWQAHTLTLRGSHDDSFVVTDSTVDYHHNKKDNLWISKQTWERAYCLGEFRTMNPLKSSHNGVSLLHSHS